MATALGFISKLESGWVQSYKIQYLIMISSLPVYRQYNFENSNANLNLSKFELNYLVFDLDTRRFCLNWLCVVWQIFALWILFCVYPNIINTWGSFTGNQSVRFWIFHWIFWLFGNRESLQYGPFELGKLFSYRWQRLLIFYIHIWIPKALSL